MGPLASVGASDAQLWNRVAAQEALYRAWKRVRARRSAPGIDGQSVGSFEHNLRNEIDRLHEELVDSSYRPRALKRFRVPKASGGWRTLGIPAVRDRVVQHRLLAVIGPLLERCFHPCSFAYRRGRSVQGAARRVMELIRSGHAHVLRADIANCFDSLDHALLLDALRERISDPAVMQLIELFLCTGAVQGMVFESPTSGTAQGSVLSPLLANVYLNPFDQQLAAKGWQRIRYADDIAVFCREEHRVADARRDVIALLNKLKLRVNRDKTTNCHVSGGCPFWAFFSATRGRLLIWGPLPHCAAGWRTFGMPPLTGRAASSWRRNL